MFQGLLPKLPARPLAQVAKRAASSAKVTKASKLCDGDLLKRPDYLRILPKQKHFLVDMIDDEESPYVFLQRHAYEHLSDDLMQARKEGLRLSPAMKDAFKAAYSQFLVSLTRLSAAQLSPASNFSLFGKEDPVAEAVDDVRLLCREELLDEFQETLLDPLRLNSCQLKVLDLASGDFKANLDSILQSESELEEDSAQVLRAHGESFDDAGNALNAANNVPEAPSALQQGLEVSLVDLEFNIGKQESAEENESAFVKLYRSSSAGLANVFLSSAPARHTQLPLTMKVHLQIKSPYVLDIFSEERSQHLLQDLHITPGSAGESLWCAPYFNQGYEVHSVVFEATLGNYGNRVGDVLAIRQQLKKIMSRLRRGESFNADEWKIADFDFTLQNKF